MKGWNRVSFNSTADRVDHVESFAPARFGTVFEIELTSGKHFFFVAGFGNSAKLFV